MPSSTFPFGPRPQKNTWGGWTTFTSYASGLNATGSSQSTVSGPGDFQIQSGNGRLDMVFVNPSQTLGGLPNITSGASVVFYDGAVATSGGPYQASGHRVLYVTPNCNQFVINSGFNGLN